MNEADVNVIDNCPLIQILEAQKEIHVAIGNMLRCLREVTAKALASCGVRPIPGALLACRRIIKVAGKSAEEGAEASLWAAVSTDIDQRNWTEYQVRTRVDSAAPYPLTFPCRENTTPNHTANRTRKAASLGTRPFVTISGACARISLKKFWESGGSELR